MVDNRLTAWLRPVLTLAALAGVLTLGACGGGGGSPSNPYIPPPNSVVLTVLPTTTTVYSGVPAVLTVTSGTAPFSVFSSNASILPGTQTSATTIPLLANQVNGNTPVTLTVQDASGQQVPITVTVSPSLLLPASITITGNPVCAGSNATLCSGQDGTASVVITGVGGATLAGRPVRFEVVLGQFSLIAANSTVPAQTVTVLTDQNGVAAVTLRVPVNAVTQFATLRATDVTSNSSVIGQFTIAQFVNGDSVLSVIPTGTTTFTGPNSAQCADGGIAAFYIFGGTPPYVVQTNFPTAVSIIGSPVLVSGGSFSIVTTGQCFTGLTFAITDAAGRTLLTPPTVDNVLGTGAPPPAAIKVTPTSLGPVACPAGAANVGQILATGGTGTFAVIANPATGATGGPIIVPATSSGSITVSVGASDAHGDWTINISSGTATPQQVTLHCT